MIRRRRNRAATTDVVAALQEQVRQAQALASVPEQQLLRDPRLNPATRALADSLEAERLRARLEAEHRRVLRAQQERERQAEEDLPGHDQIAAEEIAEQGRAHVEHQQQRGDR